MNPNRTLITDAIEAPCLLSDMTGWLEYFCLKNNTSLEPQQILITIKDGDMVESESGVDYHDLTCKFYGTLLYSDLAINLKDYSYKDGWRTRNLPLAEVGTVIFQMLDEASQVVTGHVVVTISQNVKSKDIHLDFVETGKSVSDILGVVNPFSLNIFKLVNFLLPESPKKDLKALHIFCLKYVLEKNGVKPKDIINIDCLGVNYTIALPTKQVSALIMSSKFGVIGDLAVIQRHDVLKIIEQLMT